MQQRQSKVVTVWVPSSPLDPGHWDTYIEVEDFNPDGQINPNPTLPPGWGGNGGGGGGTGLGYDDSWMRYPIRYYPPGVRLTPIIECNGDKVMQILSAFDRAIQNPCFNCLPKLRDCMIRNWQSRKIVITCYTYGQPPCSSDPNLNGRAAETQHRMDGGFNIALCDIIWDRFYDYTRLDRYLMDVLIHEMAHVCMGGLGTEVEALAVQYLCNRDSETSKPNVEDWAEFIDETTEGYIDGTPVRIGQFIALDPATGRVWAIDPDTKRIIGECFKDVRLRIN